MKRFRMLGLALMAVFALGAVLSASAFALPELLPQKAGTAFTGASVAGSEPELVGPATVECKAATATGVQTNDTSGTFHISFTGCKALGFACKGSEASDGSGVILTLGSFDYVYDTLTPTLGVAVLFLPTETSFECTALAKIKVKGEVLCLILEPTVSKTEHQFHCLAEGKKQLEKTWWNDAGTAQTAELTSSLNGGAFSESSEIALAVVTFPAAVAFENV